MIHKVEKYYERKALKAAQSFVQSNYSRFEAPLKAMMENQLEVRERAKTDLDVSMYGYDLPLKEDDLFSNPFCKAYSYYGTPYPTHFSNEWSYTSGHLRVFDIGQVFYKDQQEVIGSKINEDYYWLKHWWHFRRSVDLSVFNTKILVDSTIGQAINLDLAIATEPQLFIGRIMVAIISDARHKLGLEYHKDSTPFYY